MAKDETFLERNRHARFPNYAEYERYENYWDSHRRSPVDIIDDILYNLHLSADLPLAVLASVL